MAAVRNNRSRHRYELEIDGAVAFASYREAANVITFTHTEVPEALSGKGIGSRLAKGALQLARDAGDKVAATCQFIASYLKRHGAEYQDILAEPGESAGPATGST
jgi:uncharacterized protein